MYENNLNAAPGSAVPTATDFNSASGPVPIRMTNDYLFRALLQRNNRVLKGLIASLLHLDASAIASVEITNPIELGSAISDKTFFLDVKVLMNGSAVINLEMQVLNEHNWPERSLSYLCRAFDSLNSGEGYHLVKASVQIGLLDFTLFPKYPEFYATYQFLNIKNHMLYSDKLRLSVVDLTQTDLATAEDRLYHIDCWACSSKPPHGRKLKCLHKRMTSSEMLPAPFTSSARTRKFGCSARPARIITAGSTPRSAS